MNLLKSSLYRMTVVEEGTRYDAGACKVGSRPGVTKSGVVEY